MQITQKNRLSLLVATGLFCAPLQASGQSNWYAGLSAGCALTNQKITSDKIQPIATNATYKAMWGDFLGKKNSKAKLNVGLFGGWGYQFANGFTLRGELSFSSIFGNQDVVRAKDVSQENAAQFLLAIKNIAIPGGATAVNTIQANLAGNENLKTAWDGVSKEIPTAPGTANITTSVKRNFAISFAPQIGFTFCKNTFVFAEFGVGIAATDLTILGVSAKYGAILFSPGAGIEYGFGNWRLGLKYNYEFSKSKKFGNTNSINLNTQNHLINARISYAF